MIVLLPCATLLLGRCYRWSLSSWVENSISPSSQILRAAVGVRPRGAELLRGAQRIEGLRRHDRNRYQRRS